MQGLFFNRSRKVFSIMFGVVKTLNNENSLFIHFIVHPHIKAFLNILNFTQKKLLCGTFLKSCFKVSCSYLRLRLQFLICQKWIFRLVFQMPMADSGPFCKGVYFLISQNE